MVGEPCDCGVAGQMRTCRCNDCFQLPLTCKECFIRQHKNQPFHWVQQWNGNFFVRCDISTLGHIIILGHHGNPCPNISNLMPPTNFLVAHTNGIHRTRVVFCTCIGPIDRMQQLLSSQLFPATTERPTAAFTFGLLREFHMHSLESKATAYGYMGGLRRLTDNMFTTDVPVSVEFAL
jgi:CxC2 like cysteine cluster associated with KDZ transposases